jgi:murein DD-endopeptidase MepM/ murein hydrolase activator NlpD
LKENHKLFTSVFSFSIAEKKLFHLDLSVDNEELNHFDLFSIKELGSYIQRKTKEKNADIAIGGYTEDRMVYRKSPHFGEGPNARSIHLGIDVWLPAGSNIHAPYEAQIHSLKNNDHFGDYGPTIILEHQVGSFYFYTLYGHLSKISLEGINPGQKIEKGQVFATLGDEEENGNWPPHLHFQIIKDMGKNRGDFPGVASKKEKAKMLDICPDPMLILNT